MSLLKWLGFDRKKKPSEKWEVRIVSVTPVHVGDFTKEEFPFLVQIRIKRLLFENAWTDYEHYKTVEFAEKGIHLFKSKLDTHRDLTFIKTVF